ncbi:MAG: alpha-galactosidase [Lentisphaerae bacterium]|nr:alpha-galactosidase [Lentisphaerota bacterium]
MTVQPSFNVSLPLDVHIENKTGALTLAHPGQAGGWFGLQFYVIHRGRERSARFLSAGRHGKTWRWSGRLAPGVNVELVVAPARRGHGQIITPSLINRRKTAFLFSGYGFRAAEGAAGVRLRNPGYAHWVYAHTDNLRYENLPHCRPEFPFIRPLPASPVRLGAPGSGPIPALLLGHALGRMWLLEGALTQQRHYPTWHLAIPSDPGRAADYRSEYAWTGGAPETAAAGSRITLESTLYRIVSASPDKLYAPYMEELTAHHRFAGSGSRLNRTALFCTWNFNVYTQITEADCLKRMAVVARCAPGSYFQIDHGYQKLDPATGLASIDLDPFYPDPENAWDPDRFPSGPRGFTAACRRRHLRPTLWWSPRVNRDGIIARTHPEWLLRDRTGTPIDIEHLLLDPSVPGARAFIDRCLHTFLVTWGFEGIKVDFVSYMFDHPRAVFRHGGTGIHWKRWFHGRVRSLLGPKGYFLHCISCPMGNPFLALNGCDALRVGMDIHSGEWAHHVKTCAWLLPLILAAGRNTWYADLDGFMGKPEIPALERRSRNAFGYISGGLLDFSGPIETLDPAALSEFRRLAERCDQGTGVECPETEPFYGLPTPRILIRRHAPNSFTRKRFGVQATVGFFNWTDAPETVSLPLDRLAGGPVRLRDFWTGRPAPARGGLLTATLPPRGHGLWDVCC